MLIFMRMEEVMMEAYRDFQSLGIVPLFKLGDSNMGEHDIISILNCTYTYMGTLFKMFNRSQNRKTKNKKEMPLGSGCLDSISDSIIY